MIPKSLSPYSIVLHVALLVFGVLVLLLARENRKLEEVLEATSLRTGNSLESGQQLPDVAVIELDGRRSELSFQDAADSLLFLFTTTCSVCEENLDRWLDLHRRFDDRFQIVAIGLDDLEATRAYVEEHDLPFRVVVPADRQYFPTAFGVLGVPETILVGAGGEVKDIRLGVLKPDFDQRLAAETASS